MLIKFTLFARFSLMSMKSKHTHYSPNAGEAISGAARFQNCGCVNKNIHIKLPLSQCWNIGIFSLNCLAQQFLSLKAEQANT